MSEMTYEEYKAACAAFKEKCPVYTKESIMEMTQEELDSAIEIYKEHVQEYNELAKYVKRFAKEWKQKEQKHYVQIRGLAEEMRSNARKKGLLGKVVTNVASVAVQAAGKLTTVPGTVLKNAAYYLGSDAWLVETPIIPSSPYEALISLHRAELEGHIKTSYIQYQNNNGELKTKTVKTVNVGEVPFTPLRVEGYNPVTYFRGYDPNQ